MSFDIGRGEIFGFVGSNGCGKTTTMKMLTGLLPASDGTALLFGRPVDAGGMASRARVGYMSQSFSLYTELTVRQNLDLHARLFHLPADKARQRIDGLIRRFGLGDYVGQLASTLPLGIRQRLSLAVAIVHQPELLILDEPTSGVDPLARDAFWELLVDLSRNQGVTIFVSTHFMNEAARCDRHLADGCRAACWRPTRPPTWSRHAAPRRSRTPSSAISRRRRPRAAPCAAQDVAAIEQRADARAATVCHRLSAVQPPPDARLCGPGMRSS